MPRSVDGLTARLGSGTVALSWVNSPLPADLGPGRVVVRRSAAGGTAPSSPTDGTAVYAGTGSSATASGLVSGRAYAFSVFRMDNSGTSAPVVAVTATLLGAPVVHVAAFLATVSTGLSLPVSWTATAGTPTSYQSFAGKAPAALSSWRTTTTAHSATFGDGSPAALVQGQVWTVAVRARDPYGNVTSLSAPVTVTVPHDDTSSKLTWSHGWRLSHPGTRWLHSEHTASHKGDSMSASLSGSTLAIIGDRGKTYGSFTVYLNGHRVAMVSAHGSSTKVRQLLWRSKKLGAGKHTLKLVVAGTKGHARVAVDAISAGP